MSACKSCGAAIVWVRTESGRVMPVDLHPTNRGNVVIRNGVAYVGAQQDDAPRYTSHFATCPDAEGWRR